jgi:hypothetical protein
LFVHLDDLALGELVQGHLDHRDGAFRARAFIVPPPRSPPVG